MWGDIPMYAVVRNPSDERLTFSISAPGNQVLAILEINRNCIFRNPVSPAAEHLLHPSLCSEQDVGAPTAPGAQRARAKGDAGGRVRAVCCPHLITQQSHARRCSMDASLHSAGLVSLDRDQSLFNYLGNLQT